MKKLVLSLIVLLELSAKAQSAGPLITGTAVNSGTGTAWNISTTTIVINSPSNALSAFLQGTNFGFNIPANASIDGIVLLSSQFTGNGPHNDTIVQLLKNGLPAGANKNSAGNLFAGSKSYGSSNDLWATTWTPADINASNFGFQFKVYNTLASSNMMYFVGQFSITVYYQTSTGNFEQTKAVDLLELYKHSESLVLNSKSGFNLNQSTVTIYNLLGEMIASTKILENGDQARIALPEHSHGYYMIKVTNGEYNYIKKVLLD